MRASRWSKLCRSTVIWEQVTGRNSFTKPTYTVHTYAPPTGGRREYKQVRKGSSGTGPAGSGVEFIQGSIIYLLVGNPGITPEDRVYLQGDVAPYPPVLYVESPQDETGELLYTKITLGSARG